MRCDLAHHRAASHRLNSQPSPESEGKHLARLIRILCKPFNRHTNVSLLFIAHYSPSPADPRTGRRNKLISYCAVGRHTDHQFGVCVRMCIFVHCSTSDITRTRTIQTNRKVKVVCLPCAVVAHAHARTLPARTQAVFLLWSGHDTKPVHSCALSSGATRHQVNIIIITIARLLSLM